jgi:RNA polymerase sigma-32 factor
VKNLPTIIQPKKGALEKLSPLQVYLMEISKYPLLTPEQEHEFAIKHFEEGDVAAAHILVTSNLRLVVKIANDFRQAQISLLDLIQEGNTGLMQAVKRFNPYKGVKLSSYAAWWIRAYILKFIMENKSQVKIGTTAAQRKLFFKLKKEAQKLLEEYDHVDTKLLAEHLDVREKDVIEMQKRLEGVDISLDAPIREGESQSTASFMSTNTIPADEVLAARQIQDLFKEHLDEFKKQLKGRDLEIFEDRLINENPLTLQEIGEKYGITRERVRQIESRIISKLKDFVAAKGQIDIEI